MTVTELVATLKEKGIQATLVEGSLNNKYIHIDVGTSEKRHDALDIARELGFKKLTMTGKSSKIGILNPNFKIKSKKASAKSPKPTPKKAAAKSAPKKSASKKVTVKPAPKKSAGKDATYDFFKTVWNSIPQQYKVRLLNEHITLPAIKLDLSAVKLDVLLKEIKSRIKE